MKKTLKTIIIIILVISTAAVSSFEAALRIYGNTDDYPLSASVSSQLNGIAKAVKKKDGNIRIMTMNLLADGKGFNGTPAKTRAAVTEPLLAAITPDVVCFQEMSFNWFCCIKRSVDYEFVFPYLTASLFNMVAILYDPDTVEVIEKSKKELTSSDGDMQRIAMWAHIRSKKDGEDLIIINTHFAYAESGNTDIIYDYQKKQALELCALTEELHEKYGCPVFCAGDFNARDSALYSDSDTFIYDLLTETFTDTKKIAVRRSCGKERSNDNAFVDHIFLYGESVKCDYFSLLSQSFFKKISDHYPIFTDFSLNY